jgi:acetone carboxylase gamma subunit
LDLTVKWANVDNVCSAYDNHEHFGKFVKYLKSFVIFVFTEHLGGVGGGQE